MLTLGAAVQRGEVLTGIGTIEHLHGDDGRVALAIRGGRQNINEPPGGAPRYARCIETTTEQMAAVIDVLPATAQLRTTSQDGEQIHAVLALAGLGAPILTRIQRIGDHHGDRRRRIRAWTIAVH